MKVELILEFRANPDGSDPVDCAGDCESAISFLYNPDLVLNGYGFLPVEVKKVVATADGRYIYTIEYDTDRLTNPNYRLNSCEVKCLFCRSCLTQYIDYMVATSGGGGSDVGVNEYFICDNGVQKIARVCNQGCDDESVEYLTVTREPTTPPSDPELVTAGICPAQGSNFRSWEQTLCYQLESPPLVWRTADGIFKPYNWDTEIPVVDPAYNNINALGTPTTWNGSGSPNGFGSAVHGAFNNSKTRFYAIRNNSGASITLTEWDTSDIANPVLLTGPLSLTIEGIAVSSQGVLSMAVDPTNGRVFVVHTSDVGGNIAAFSYIDIPNGNIVQIDDNLGDFLSNYGGIQLGFDITGQGYVLSFGGGGGIVGGATINKTTGALGSLLYGPPAPIDDFDVPYTNLGRIGSGDNWGFAIAIDGRSGPPSAYRNIVINLTTGALVANKVMTAGTAIGAYYGSEITSTPFKRVFTQDINTEVVTFQDFELITGEPLELPPGAVVVVCP